METKVVNFNDSKLIEAISSKEVVCFPTETVYGLGVIYSSEEAFNKLVNVKKRNPDKPFTLMLSSPCDIDQYANINDKTKKIISKYMPGEITILVRPKEGLYPWVTLNSKYIGIRVSGKEEVCQLIAKVKEPLLVSSANISTFDVVKDFKEAFEVFYGKIPYIVEGEVNSNLASTIVICDEELTLIREGKIKFKEIKKVWEE